MSLKRDTNNYYSIIMAVFRIEKTRDYTVMANHHLRNKALSLKAKGLLSLMLSLPEDWDYTTRGLSCICKDGVDSIRVGIQELEANGYLVRERRRNENGQYGAIEYTILEKPRQVAIPPPVQEKPILENPTQVIPMQVLPTQEIPAQLSIEESNTQKSNTDESNTHADVSALRVLKGFLVAIVGQIQPHSVTLAAHRGIVGQDMENNHMPGILVKPGQIHVVMPFVILSTGTDSGFLHELGNRLSCHSGTCVPDPLR